MNIRYLIAIGGETRVKQWGDWGVARGSGVAVFVGAWVWNRNTELVATILDLKGARPAAEMNASAQGTAWLVVIQILPLGVPAFTEANACAALGDKVARFLVDAPRDDDGDSSGRDAPTPLVGVGPEVDQLLLEQVGPGEAAVEWVPRSSGPCGNWSDPWAPTVRPPRG